jgi:hypothetical protein
MDEIDRLTKISPCEQSRGRSLRPLDCFAPLAMTAEVNQLFWSVV